MTRCAALLRGSVSDALLPTVRAIHIGGKTKAIDRCCSFDSDSPPLSRLKTSS